MYAKTKYLRSILSIVVVLLLLMTMASFAGPSMDNVYAEGPTYAKFDDGHVFFFANGTAITVSDAGSGQTKISWSGGSQTFDGNKLFIFGGSNADPASVSSSNITINSGTVYGVFGGGLFESKVGAASIKINGGSLTFVCGGGVGDIAVPSNDHIVEGKDIQGSSATVDQMDNVTVDNANLTINGGTITYLYGGGDGYNTVNNTKTIMNNGKVTGFMTVAGVNGKTGDASFIMNGGSITGTLQTVNRSSLNNATVDLKGGDVNDAYIYGTQGNATGPTGKVTGNISYTVSGSKVKNLKMGYNSNNQAITTKDDLGSSTLSLAYNKNLIENIDSNVVNVSNEIGQSFTDLTPSNTPASTNDETDTDKKDSDSPSPNNAVQPKTGDDHNLGYIALILMLSVMILIRAKTQKRL